MGSWQTKTKVDWWSGGGLRTLNWRPITQYWNYWQRLLLMSGHISGCSGNGGDHYESYASKPNSRLTLLHKWKRNILFGSGVHFLHVRLTWKYQLVMAQLGITDREIHFLWSSLTSRPLTSRIISGILPIPPDPSWCPYGIPLFQFMFWLGHILTYITTLTN